MIEKTRKLMKLLGIEDDRLRREWISASEGTKFADVVREFTNRIVELGPNSLRSRETAA